MATSDLVYTAGSASANSYVSLAEADQYHDDRPAVGTTWADATNDQKKQGILLATKLLDRLIDWEGSPSYDTQVLAWPRTGLYNALENGILDSTTIPTIIKEMTAEYARQLLASDRTSDNEIERLGLTLVKVGSIRFDFSGAGRTSLSIPEVVATMLPEHWGEIHNPNVIPLERA